MLHNEARNLLVDDFERTRNAEEVGAAFKVSASTVRRLARRRRETGSVELRVARRGRKPALSPRDLARLDAYIEARPDATVAEARRDLGFACCDETVRRAVVRLGWVFKKKSVHASERERPRRRGGQGPLEGRGGGA